MSEQEEREGEQASRTGFAQNGMVQGVPGKNIELNGVLDLRGVPAEQVAAIESIRINGLVMMDEGNRNALAGVKSEINGTVVVADPDLRVMLEPDFQLSQATLEGMPAGQKLMLVGMVFFKPDVSPALVAEKFDQLRIVGILVACEGVYGALLGKMEITGISITLPPDAGPVVRSMGQNTWTLDYVSRMQDDSTYVNIGATAIPDGISEELLARKVRAYYNVGMTTAPAPLLALLKSRCPTNLGEFAEPGGEEQEEGDD